MEICYYNGLFWVLFVKEQCIKGYKPTPPSEVNPRGDYSLSSTYYIGNPPTNNPNSLAEFIYVCNEAVAQGHLEKMPIYCLKKK